MFLIARVRRHLEAHAASRLIARSAVGMVATLLVGMLLNLVANAALARSMGVEQYGIYAYAFSWLMLLILPARLGFDRTANRFVAAYKALAQWGLLRGVIRYAAALTLAGSLIVGGSLAVASAAFAPPGANVLTTTFYIAAAALPAWAFLSLTQGFFRALKRPVLAELPDRILHPLCLLATAGGFLLLAGAGPTAAEVMTVTAAVGLAGCIFFAIMIRRLLPEPVRQAQPEYRRREWLRISLPMLIISGSSILYHRLDVIMVGALLGPVEAGIMAVAVRLSNVVSLGLTATNPMVSSVVAENYATRSIDKIQTSLRSASLLTTAITVAFAGVMILFGDHLLRLFGEQFRTAYIALVILTGGHIVNALCGSVNAVLTMTGHQDRVAAIMLVSSLLNAVLNVPLVLEFGVLGAAISTAVSVVVKNLAMLMAARKLLGLDPSVGSALFRRRKLAAG